MSSRRLLALAVLLLAAPAAHAAAPEWLRAVAKLPVPTYPAEVDAVMLLDEQVTTVNEKGEIKTIYRRAYRILRPQGRDHGNVAVPFDSETKLTFLKGWCIPAQGAEYEVKEKEALEIGISDVSLYDDNRTKVLTIPAADPGNVIGYEYEQKRRPLTLQDLWFFQDTHPVRKARYILQLPAGWEYSPFWANHAALEPRAVGENQWMWELDELAAVAVEPQMPPWRSVAGWMAVTFYPREQKLAGKTHGTWDDVGKWYFQLASQQRNSSPELKQKVADLTGPFSSLPEKINTLAQFAQREIRYVSIAIGIGGFQPHFAQQVFQNRYGDCKDKATLLSSMLREIGLDSYFVLIHTDRGVVAPDFPTPMTFNHAILAIRLPADLEKGNFYATLDHPRLGRLLFFDPTDSITPLGYLPPGLQANHGLLVTPEGGDLVQLPLLPGVTNRLMRTGKLSLSGAGVLTGEIQEVRWGSPAVSRRADFLSESKADRVKVLESFLSGYLQGFRITEASVENLDTYDSNLILRYRFVAQSYGQSAGNLLIFRPRVVGGKGSALLEIKERKYPVEFSDATVQTDQFEIELPAGFAVDEIPPGIQAAYPFAEYKSAFEVKGNVLHYSRTYEVKDVRVSTEKLDDLKKFFRQVAADERASAVLKKSF